MTTAADISRALDVKLCARATRFFDTREWSKHQGHYGEVGYDKPMPLTFLGAKLKRFEALHQSAHPTWVPLAEIGKEESLFVAIDVSQEACPVGLWTPDVAKFVAHAESLDLFLESLGKTPAKTRAPVSNRLEQLIEFSNRADRLLDLKPTKKNLAACRVLLDESDPWFAPDGLPRQRALKGGPYHSVLGLAVFKRARLQQRLGLHEAALKTIRESVQDGEPLTTATETECELLSVLGRRDEALKVFLDNEETWSSELLKAALLFGAGRRDEAQRVLEARLSKKPAARQKLIESFVSRAEQLGLDVSALVSRRTSSR